MFSKAGGQSSVIGAMENVYLHCKATVQQIAAFFVYLQRQRTLSTRSESILFIAQPHLILN